MSELSLLKRDASFDKCPQCKAVGTLRRSRGQNTFEQAVKKINLFNYYRCRGCGWRGSRFTLRLNKISFKTVFIYLFLMFATAMLVMFVIKKIALK